MKSESISLKQRLFPNLVEAVINCTKEIFFENKYADKAIERILKSNPKWGARDRAFIAENTYNMVRWWRLLQFVSGVNENETKDKIYHLFAALQILNGNDLPDWKEFNGFNFAGVKALSFEAQKTRKIRESIPDWLDELGQKELGGHWEAEIQALNKPADLIVRANTLKISREDLLKQMNAEDIKASKISTKDGIIIHKRINLFSTRFMKEGLLEIQDGASQQVGEYMQVEPGMRVIDACAGAGGKSLHLSALMENKGRLISMDVEQFKLDELKKRARRNGAGNIETKLIESSKTIKRLQGSADRLLLDVPCSGLGVIRRNPDAKWKLSPEFITEVKKTQQHIISSYSNMLKPGGKMVYATCSILPSEDEEQVQTFLKANSNFKIISEKRISVAESGFDGFYMALLERKN